MDSFFRKGKWHEHLHDGQLFKTSKMTERASNVWSSERNHGSSSLCDSWIKRKTAFLLSQRDCVSDHICRWETGYAGHNTCYSDISKTRPRVGQLSNPVIPSWEQAVSHWEPTSVFLLGWGWGIWTMSVTGRGNKGDFRSTLPDRWPHQWVSELEEACQMIHGDPLASEMRGEQARKVRRFGGSPAGGRAGTRDQVSSFPALGLPALRNLNTVGANVAFGE